MRASVWFLAPAPGSFSGPAGWYVTDLRGGAVLAGPFPSESLAREEIEKLGLKEV